MQKKVYKIVDYSYMSRFAFIIFPLCGIFTFIAFLIKKEYIILALSIFCFLAFALLWLFERKAYIIDINENIIRFPRCTLPISEIDNIETGHESYKAYLPKSSHEEGLRGMDFPARHREMEEYEEVEIDKYNLILSGSFGKKSFSFSEEPNRDKVYEILKEQIKS